MVWSILPEEKAAFLELRHGSDRAAGIVAGSMVEIRLTAALKSCLHQDDKITKQFFKIGGPVGQLGPKADLAYLTGLISRDCYRDIVFMKDVRNAFAHQLEVTEFKDQPIRDWVANLKLVERHTCELGEAFDNAKHGNTVHAVENRAEWLAKPRLRYLLSAEVLCGGFGVFLTHGLRMPKVPWF